MGEIKESLIFTINAAIAATWDRVETAEIDIVGVIQDLM